MADLERDRDGPAGEELDVSDAPQVKGNRLDPWLDNYAARAHGLVETGHGRGKVVVDID